MVGAGPIAFTSLCSTPYGVCSVQCTRQHSSVYFIFIFIFIFNQLVSKGMISTALCGEFAGVHCMLGA